jgi:hypothetical protein
MKLFLITEEEVEDIVNKAINNISLSYQISRADIARSTGVLSFR